VDAVRNFQT